MRWIAASACLLLAGCGGLERQQYPMPVNEPVVIGSILHAQPYDGEGAESGWSRLGWGSLAGGLIVGATAGLAEPGSHSLDANSYLVKPASEGRQPLLFNALDALEVGDCVAVYKSVRNDMYSLSRLPPGRCDT